MERLEHDLELALGVEYLLFTDLFLAFLLLLLVLCYLGKYLAVLFKLFFLKTTRYDTWPILAASSSLSWTGPLLPIMLR